MGASNRIERSNLFLAALTLGMALYGVWVAKTALDENTKLRWMTLQQELYADERWWYDQMSEHPFAYSLWCEFDSDIKSEDYIRTCIQLASPGQGPELPIPRNIDELMRQLWHSSSFSPTTEKDLRAQNLRRAFDIAEVIFYHLERIHSYHNEEVMDPEEANTWLGIINQIGPHPLFLAAAEDARRHGYVTPGYARWIVDSLSTDARWKLIEEFYPYMAKTPDKWVADFERTEANLRILYPKGKPK